MILNTSRPQEINMIISKLLKHKIISMPLILTAMLPLHRLFFGSKNFAARTVAALILIMFMAIQWGPVAQALSADQLQIFQSGINYYDEATCSNADSGAATGTITPGKEVPDDQLPGNNNQAKIWNYLMAQGYTTVQAAGIMGNIHREGVFDPTNSSENPNAPHDSKDPSVADPYGWGLIGFTPGSSVFGSPWNVSGVNVTKDNVYYISTQLDIVYGYMKNSNAPDGKNMLQEFQNKSTTPAKSADAFENLVENAGVVADSVREGYANDAMKAFGNNAPAGDPSPSANNAAPLDIGDIMTKYNLQSAMIQQVNGGVVAAASAHQPPTTPASTMKLIIADVALRSGLDLSKTVPVTSDLYYDGSAQDMGSSTTLRNALMLMLNQSNNVAANVLMKAMGGVDGFTQKAQNYGYNDTNVKGYYDPANDGKNTSTIADEVSAMNHIFSTNGANYQTAQDALEDAAKNDNHYDVADDIANKWAGTTDVAGNVGLFNINGNQYIIGLYYNGSMYSSAAQNAIKNGSADLENLVKNNPTASASSVTTSSCSCPSGSAAGATTLTGSDNEDKVWNFLKAAGLSDAAVAGIMGSFQQESGFVSTAIEGGGNTKDPASAGHTGWGLAQWYGDDVEGEAKDNNITGPIYELLTQLNLVLAQMKGTSPTGIKDTFDAMKNMTDPVQAATYFTPNFEGGTDPGGVRESNATSIYGEYNGTGGGSTATSSGDESSGGCGSSNLSPDCQTAAGDAKILCAAQQYDTVSYSESTAGNHLPGGNPAWLKTCPTIGPSCYLDCSGLVNIAVYDAFGYDLMENTYAEASDTQNWQHIQMSQIQPGDLIQPNPGHVEIIDHVTSDKIFTFGAHSSSYPQPDQVGPTSYPKDSSYVYLHWIGQGSS